VGFELGDIVRGPDGRNTRGGVLPETFVGGKIKIAVVIWVALGNRYGVHVALPVEPWRIDIIIPGFIIH
jgi:hypothetical protein